MSEGLTLAKLMAAKSLLEANDVPDSDRTWILPYHWCLQNAFRPGLKRRRRSYWITQWLKDRGRKRALVKHRVRDPFAGMTAAQAEATFPA